MRIDAHQHFWRTARRNTRGLMTPCRLCGAIFCPLIFGQNWSDPVSTAPSRFRPRQTLGGDKWLLELAAASPFVLGVVGWVDLQSPDVVRNWASWLEIRSWWEFVT